MRQMMEGVVLKGTCSAARLAGYTVGGKTGSAQIFDVAAKHYTHTYNGSFVGFAPLTNPSLVVAVTLNGTRGTSGFGGAAAAPVVKVVAGGAFGVLDVPEDLPDEALDATLVTDLEALAGPDGRPAQPSILEEEDDEAVLAAADGHQTVPNFKRKTMRAVLADAAAKGFRVPPAGS